MPADRMPLSTFAPNHIASRSRDYQKSILPAPRRGQR